MKASSYQIARTLPKLLKGVYHMSKLNVGIIGICVGLTLVILGFYKHETDFTPQHRDRKIFVKDIRNGQNIKILPAELGTTSQELNSKYCNALIGLNPESKEYKELWEAIQDKFSSDFMGRALNKGYIPIAIVDAASYVMSLTLIGLGVVSVIFGIVWIARAEERPIVCQAALNHEVSKE
jgi:hypothetical protein